MKTYKIIFMGIIITVIAIGHVHQKIELVKTGYSLQENRKYLSFLVNQNAELLYNLSRLESPRYLLDEMDPEKVEFASRRTNSENGYQFAGSDSGAGSGDGFVEKFLDLFTLKAEARSHK